MPDLARTSLSHDPVHGYIPFVSNTGLAEGEVSERQLIDHPWVQRLRQIHQLQTAWWVYPSAEHTRFQHVLGVMHLAGRAATALDGSLRAACPDVPSPAYVEALLRMAGLLHDVGHGPFGHFFDEHFLAQFGLTHETLGRAIIVDELGPLLRRVRRTPHGELAADETLDPAHVALLIARPKADDENETPRWLQFLRSLFCGLYTVDNMDFVLRDAFMSGFSARAFDLERLLQYSFFSSSGLTIHARGLDALIRFMGVRAEMFRSVYFHRTVRAIDLTLADLFAAGQELLFPGNPLERLGEYQRFTEWSLLVDVARWPQSEDPRKRELGERWRQLLNRHVHWKMVCQRNLVFAAGPSERTSLFSRKTFIEQALRESLPPHLRELPLRIDLPRTIHRPGTRGPAAGQNYLYDPARDLVRPLEDDQLYRQLPGSHRWCRIYAESLDHVAELTAALDELIGPLGHDDVTNM